MNEDATSPVVGDQADDVDPAAELEALRAELAATRSADKPDPGPQPEPHREPVGTLVAWEDVDIYGPQGERGITTVGIVVGHGDQVTLVIRLGVVEDDAAALLTTGPGAVELRPL